MITAILALVGTIVSGVFGAVNAAKASYEIRQRERQANIDFERGKELSYYSTYKNQEMIKGLAILAGIILIVILVVKSKKK